ARRETAVVRDVRVCAEEVDVTPDLALLGEDALAQPGVDPAERGERVGDGRGRGVEGDRRAAVREGAEGSRDEESDAHQAARARCLRSERALPAERRPLPFSTTAALTQ